MIHLDGCDIVTAIFTLTSAMFPLFFSNSL